MEIVQLKVQVNRAEFDALQADVKKLRGKTVKIKVDASGFNSLDKATLQSIRDVSGFVDATTKAKKASTDWAKAQKQVSDANTKAAAATKQVGTAASQAAKSSKLLGDSIGNIAAKMAGWQIMGELVSKPIAAFKDAIQTMKEVDSELVNIQKVTGSTDAEMAKLTERAYEMASAYGRTATEVLSASTEFARAGYGDQIESLSEMSILLQNVGDVSSETANKFLLSVDAAWKLGGSEKELMAVMDGLNEITNRNATDMDKLATGMTVAATYFAESGESIQTFSALMGAGTAITQRSGAEIGRALKAITMNIRQVRGETEDGELINDESIAKAAAALKDFAGISTMENGELRLTSDVLDELAGKWDTLSQVQQSAIAEALGGKYHSNVVAALMGDWEKVEKMMTDYAEGAGSAMRENEIYMDSWEAKSKQLSSTWAEFVSHVLETDTIKFALDGAIGAIELLDSTTGQAVITMTALGAAFMGAGKAATAFKATDIGSTLLGMTASVTDLKAGLSLLGEVMAKNPLFAVGGAVAVAAGIAAIIDGVTTTVDEQREKVADLQAQYDELAGPGSEYAALIEKSASGTDQLTQAEQNRLEILRAQAEELRRQVEAEKELEFEKFQQEQGPGGTVFEGSDRYRTSMSADVAKLKDMTDAQERLNKALLDGASSEEDYRAGLQGIIAEQEEYYTALSEYKDLGFELTDAQNQFLESYELMLDRLANTKPGDMGIRLAFEEFEGVADIANGEIERTVVNVKKLKDSMMDAGATAEDVERTLSNMDADENVVTFDVEGNTDEAIAELEELGIAIKDVNGAVSIDFGAFLEMADAIGLSTDEIWTFISTAVQADGITLTNARGEVITLQNALDILGATEAEPTITADTSAATSAVEDFIGKLNSIPRKITTILSTQNNGSIPTLGTFPGKAKGDKNFSGGTVLLGDQYSPTGKPMPELVITKGSAFIAGANGPEIRNLPAGSQILPYSETQKVLARSGMPTNSIPAFADGANLWKYYYGSSSTGGGSSGSSGGSSGGGSSSGSAGRYGSSSGGGSGVGSGVDWEARIKLLESELRLMEAQGKSASELAAKMREIQAALHGQAEEMRGIGGDQAEINDLSTEWWEIHEDILDAYRDEMKNERDLLRSQLELMENQGRSAGERIAKLKEIQANLEEEIALMKELGASQKEITDLTNDWYDAQKDIEGIQKDLWAELEDAVDYQLKQARKVRDERLEALDKELEALREAREEKQEQVTLEEKLLAVEQARIALANAQNERTVRTFNMETGQWEWVADAGVVKDAEEALDDAKKDLAEYEEELAYEAAVAEIEAKKEAIEEAYNALEEEWERITDSLQAPTRSINSILDDIAQHGTPQMKAQIENVNVMLGKLNDYIAGAISGDPFGSMMGSYGGGTGGGGGGGKLTGTPHDYSTDPNDYSELMANSKSYAEYMYWAQQRKNKIEQLGIDVEGSGYKTNDEIHEKWLKDHYGESTFLDDFGNRWAEAGDDGKAPSDLGPGDIVMTKGGYYRITGYNDDNSFKSELMSDEEVETARNAKRERTATEIFNEATKNSIRARSYSSSSSQPIEEAVSEVVSDFVSTLTGDSEFQQRMSGFGYVYNRATTQVGDIAKSASGSIVNNNYGNSFHYGDVILTEAQAKSITLYDLAQQARTLGIYGNT